MRLPLKTDFRTRPPHPFCRANGRYYIRQHLNGLDTWRSLHTKNKNEAEAMAYRIWFAQQSPTIQSVFEAPAMPLALVWERYEQSEKYKDLEKSTAETRKIRWTLFVRWCASRQIATIDKVRKDTAELFLTDRQCKAKTWNNIRGDLMQVWRSVENLGSGNPWEEIGQKNTKKGDGASNRTRMLTDDEIGKILEHLTSSSCCMDHRLEWALAVKIAVATGLRYKSVITLKWEDVDGGLIQHVPPKTARFNKHVSILVSAQLAKELAAVPRKSVYIMPGLAKYGHAATNPFSRLLRRLEIENTKEGIAGFHSLRSTFITKAIAAKVDVSHLGGVVGHTSKKQTEAYNRAAETLDLAFIDLSAFVANASNGASKKSA